MRTKHLSFVVLFVVVFAAMVAAPASAGTIIPGVSFPLLEERPTMVEAGVNQLVTFGDRPLGDTAAFYKSGFLLGVRDGYGIFNDLGFCRVDPQIMRIETKHLKAVETKVMHSTQHVDLLSTEGDRIIIDIEALDPGLYVIVTNVTHNQSRVDRRGILATLGQLFGIKKHEHVTTTDAVGMIFGVIDADDFIATFSETMFGVCDPRELNNEQVRLLRAAFFEQELRGTVQPARPLPAYSLLADAYARKVQGFPGAFQRGQSDMEKQLAALQQQNEQLQGQLAQSQQASEAAQRAAADAEQRRIDEYNRLTAERAQATDAATAREHAIATWVNDLKAKHAGRTGFLFVAVGDNGLPTWADVDLHLWQLDRECGWKYNSRSPITVCGGVGEWFWQEGSVPTTAWLGIGFSSGPDSRPTCAFQLHTTGLRVIAVRPGGESYEAK
ncbi:MAG: hypothetical protein BWY19_00950 [bacterium ADurb.Bin212]|nr:MAG: hypothetical protein BWY19_00950 [bacterium ADurb.Bin212]